MRRRRSWENNGGLALSQVLGSVTQVVAARRLAVTRHAAHGPHSARRHIAAVVGDPEPEARHEDHRERRRPAQPAVRPAHAGRPDLRQVLQHPRRLTRGLQLTAQPSGAGTSTGAGTGRPNNSATRSLTACTPSSSEPRGSSWYITATT